MRVTDTVNHSSTTSAPLSFTTSDPTPSVSLAGNATNFAAGSLYSLTVGTITDAGVPNYTKMTVHWGDGSANDWTIGQTPTHRYTEAFTFASISVDLIESGTNRDNNVGTPLNVFIGPDTPTLPPSDASGTPVTISEGSSYTLNFGAIQNVGNKSEIEGVIVNWGDGNSSVVFGDPSNQSVSHVYSSPSAAGYNVTADLYEYYSFHFGIVKEKVIVTDVAPTIFADSFYSRLNEGDTEFLFLFSPFYNTPNFVNDHVTGFEVNWGDGHTDSYAGVDPSYQFLEHQYQVPSPAGSPYQIHVNLFDNEGKHLNTEFFPESVTVNFLPPHIAVTPPTGSVNSGDSYSITLDHHFNAGTQSIVGNLTDPGTGNFVSVSQYKINWGDGHTDTITAKQFSDDSGVFSHTYVKGGTFNPTVTVTTPGGTYNNVGSPVSVGVTSQATFLTLTGGAHATEGTQYDLTLSPVDSFLVDFLGLNQYSVDWGDGTAQNPDIVKYDVVPDQEVVVSHTYADGINTTGDVTATRINAGLVSSFFGFTFDNLGSKDIFVQNVTPTVSITSGPKTSNEGTSVTFTGTFTDPGAQADHDYLYTWTVTSDNAQTVPGQSAFVTTYTGSGTSVPDLNFTPGDNGTYHIKLTVKDKDGAIGTSSTQTLTVSNVLPVVSVISGPITAKEGDPVQYLATFTDPGTTYDQSYTYKWHVTTTNAQIFADQTGTVPTSYNASGTPVPSLSFTPGDNGTYTISLTVTDKDNGASLTASKTLTVSNVIPTAIITTGPATANEGDPVSYTATFTDPGTTYDDNYKYLWHVTTTNAQVIADQTASVSTYNSNGTPVPALTFTPGDNGTYTISLTVTDKDNGASVTVSKTLTVSNVIPTAVITTGPTTANEGDPVSYTATFTDPGTTFDTTFTYKWHVTTTNAQIFTDQTGTVPAAFSASGTPVPGLSFTPGDNGTYTIFLTVTDKDNAASVTVSRVLTVSNVKPTAVITGGPTTINEGTNVTYTGTFTDPGTTYDDSYQYTWHVSTNNTQTISDQSGSVSSYSTAGTGVPNFTFLADDNGTYIVNLTVTDKDNAASTTVTRTLTVNNVAPTATFTSPPGVKVKNQPISFNFSNQFDPSHIDTVAGFKYFFDFNNNGNFTDVNDFHGSTGNFPNSADINGQTSATAIFRFPHQGDFTVRARIQDKDGGFTDYTATVTIIDTDVVSVATGGNIQSEVKTYDSASGALKFDITPFPKFTGAVEVAQADFNGDYYPEVVVAAGAGGGPNVKVYEGKTGRCWQISLPTIPRSPAESLSRPAMSTATGWRTSSPEPVPAADRT